MKEAANEIDTVSRESRQDFESLMDIQAPDLLPLDDEAMFDEFVDFSRKLDGS